MRVREGTQTDIPAIARVRIASWRTTYVGIVAQEVLDGLNQEDAERRIRQHLGAGSFYYVAEEESGNIVGFVTGGPQHDGDREYTGEVYALYLLQSHQGRGLGKQLMTQAAERLAAAGHTSLLVWCIKTNAPACRFYEALGGSAVREQQFQIGPDLLTEVGYGWADTALLRNRG